MSFTGLNNIQLLFANICNRVTFVSVSYEKLMFTTHQTKAITWHEE